MRRGDAMKKGFLLFAFVVSGSFIFINTEKASAAELSVLASPAMKEAYLELVPQFEKASGHKVVTTWAGTADVMKRVGGAGEVFDVVIVARNSLDQLAKQGRIVPASRTDLVKSGVGIAVRA